MPRVVPSQVVEQIARFFPEAKTQNEGGKEISLSASHSLQLAPSYELAQEIPSELLVLDPEPYVEYRSSIAGLREFLERGLRNLGSYSISGIPGLRHLSPVTLIRQALEKCPDQFPSHRTAELKVIKTLSTQFKRRLISSCN